MHGKTHWDECQYNAESSKQRYGQKVQLIKQESLQTKNTLMAQAALIEQLN
jgi:hypothetical protein